MTLNVILSERSESEELGGGAKTTSPCPWSLTLIAAPRSAPTIISHVRPYRRWPHTKSAHFPHFFGAASAHIESRSVRHHDPFEPRTGAAGRDRHEPGTATTVLVRPPMSGQLGPSQTFRTANEPVGGNMATLTESRFTVPQAHLVFPRLPFAPEPIGPRAAPSRRLDREFCFTPGAWERIMVAAELDRESRDLSLAL